jgi:hypothetical protein
MTETNSCVEKGALIDYLYGEADAETRVRVEAHLRTCVQCADEVGGLNEVRGTLDAWTPPEAELGFHLVSNADPKPATASLWSRIRRPPVWGLAAAAAVVLTAAAVIARPEIQFGRDGMVLRIGWSETGADALAQPGAELSTQVDPATLGAEPRQGVQVVRGTPAGSGSRSSEVVPVQRGAAQALVSGAMASDSDDALLQSMRQLIRESEQRQERALAARVQLVEQQLAERRQAELVEMRRAFGEFEVTGEELVRRGDLFDYLTRISAR